MSLLSEALTVEPVFIVVGALSCIGSFFVVATAIVFPNLTSGRFFMKLLVMISMSDFIASFAFSWGYVEDPALCAWQGGLEIFFFRATWLWTLALSHQLFSLAKHGKLSLTFSKLSLGIWTLNIILEILPLLIPNGFNNTSENIEYGTDDARYGKIVCSLRSKVSVIEANNVAFAVLFTPLCAVLLALAYLWFRMRRLLNSFSAEIRQVDNINLRDPLLNLSENELQFSSVLSVGVDLGFTSDTDSERQGQPSIDSIMESTNTSDQSMLGRMDHITTVMWLYPIVLFVCWFPLLLFFCLANGFRKEDRSASNFSDDPWKYIEVFTLAIAAMHGFFLASIFFANSLLARQCWIKLFQSKYSSWCDNLCSREK